MAKSSSKNAPKEVQEENSWKSWMLTKQTDPVVAVIVIQWLVVLGLMKFFLAQEEILRFVDKFCIRVATGFFFLALVTLLSLAHFPSLCSRIPVNFICFFFLTLSQAMVNNVIVLIDCALRELGCSASTAIIFPLMCFCNVFFHNAMLYSVPLIFFNMGGKNIVLIKT